MGACKLNETVGGAKLARATCETLRSVDALIYDGAANKDNKLPAAVAARRGFVADKPKDRQAGRQDVPQGSDKSNS